MKSLQIAVVGLGYVGLPLAVELGKTPYAPVIGFDVNAKRIQELQEGRDGTNEIESDALAQTNISYTANEDDLQKAQFFIVAVPTPINDAHEPDLSYVTSASELVARHISPGAVVVFESTVYPGVTEEVCMPIIEKVSGLTCGKDWKIGYSPERVNPGDKEHTIDRVVKIVSGMDEDSLNVIAEVYGSVCKAGVHRASGIKVAEAAKVIENVQRDLNIALVNELALIFDRLGIATRDVIEAAGTKWNFHKYTPGLVGGHCIGVDPYYLTHKAQELGYIPEVILAGRRINDNMPNNIVQILIKDLARSGKALRDIKVIVYGLTFKEDVPDIRNSKAIQVIDSLQQYGAHVTGVDPVMNAEDVSALHISCDVVPRLEDVSDKVDAMVVVSPHKDIRLSSSDRLTNVLYDNGFIFDIKGALSDIPRNIHYRAL